MDCKEVKKMDEEKPQGEEQESTNTGEGSEQKTISLYEQTNQATERLEKANAKTEELLNRQEELYQKQQLGGITEAGHPQQPELSKEEQASRERIMAVGRATGARWAQEENEIHPKGN